MNEINLDKLCYYCYGCNQLEQEEFNGIRKCDNFEPVIFNWQSEYLKGLKNNAKSE